MANLTGQLHNKINKTVITKTVDLNMASGNQVITESGKVFNQVTVNKPSTMVAGNIKDGITIGGVEGTFSETSTNPTSTDVKSGKTVFANGEQIDGAMPEFTDTVPDYTTNGQKTLATAGKYVPNDITFNVNVPGVEVQESTATYPIADGIAISHGKFIELFNTRTQKFTIKYSSSSYNNRIGHIYQFIDSQGKEMNKFFIFCPISGTNLSYGKGLYYIAHIDINNNNYDLVFDVSREIDSTSFSISYPTDTMLFRLDDGNFCLLTVNTQYSSNYSWDGYIFSLNEDTYDLTYLNNVSISPKSDSSSSNRAIFPYPRNQKAVTKIRENVFIIPAYDSYLSNQQNVLMVFSYDSTTYTITKTHYTTTSGHFRWYNFTTQIENDIILCIDNNSYQYNNKIIVVIYKYNEDTQRLTILCIREPSSSTNYILGSGANTKCYRFIKYYDSITNTYKIFFIHPTQQSNYLAYSLITLDTINTTLTVNDPIIISENIKYNNGYGTDLICIDETNNLYKFTEGYSGDYVKDVIIKIDTTNYTCSLYSYSLLRFLYGSASFNPSLYSIYTFNNIYIPLSVNCSITTPEGSDYYWNLNIVKEGVLQVKASTNKIEGITIEDSSNNQVTVAYKNF